jgi:predicted GNAT family acetyltransferase
MFLDAYEQVDNNTLDSQDNHICTIVVDRSKNKPIAIAMYYVAGYSKISYQTFVAEEYRRKGIGTRLFKRVKKDTRARTIVTWPHDDASDAFFYSVRPNYMLDEL